MSATTSLTVVIPLYNDRGGIAETLESVVERLAEAPGFVADVIVVDDGSTDGGGDVARAFAGRLHLRVLAQANSGRFATRERGLAAATGDYVLFLDAGVALVEDGLRFVSAQIAEGNVVWNAHTVLEHGGNPYGVFWSILSSLAFSAYLDSPRTTSFGAEEFDRFPKGTGCFLAPRALVEEAFSSFSSAYLDTRYANDDAPILRAIAMRERINISPAFACVYRPRSAFRPFVRHAFHRGTVFVDGHGRRESRYFPLAVLAFPASVAALAATIRKPAAGPAVLIATSIAAGVAARRRPRREQLQFAALAPVYAVAHVLGMWRGAALAAAKKLHG